MKNRNRLFAKFGVDFTQICSEKCDLISGILSLIIPPSSGDTFRKFMTCPACSSEWLKFGRQESRRRKSRISGVNALKWILRGFAACVNYVSAVVGSKHGKIPGLIRPFWYRSNSYAGSAYSSAGVLLLLIQYLQSGTG